MNELKRKARDALLVIRNSCDDARWKERGRATVELKITVNGMKQFKRLGYKTWKDCLRRGYPVHYQKEQTVRDDRQAVVVYDFIEDARRAQKINVPTPQRSECLVRPNKTTVLDASN